MTKTTLVTNKKVDKIDKVVEKKEKEEEEKIEFEKPLLKWIGGKTQILNKVLDNFPTKMKSYHELFLGGGSVLLGFLTLVKHKKIILDGKVYAYDLNSVLIALYKNIQTHRVELYDEIMKLVEPYHALFPNDKNDKKKKKEELDVESEDEETNDSESEEESEEKSEEEKITPEKYFYDIRTKYNKLTDDGKKSLKGSAMFVFLNKTCFRGMYRMGPNGFNVPYGNYKKPEIINKNHLNRIHKLIKDVEFREGDFKTSMTHIKSGDFTYLDPPYAPESKTSFVKYNKEGFTVEKNLELFDECNKFKAKNIKFLMSNSYVELVTNAFQKEEFKIEKIICKRSINSKKPGSKTTEVLIKNF